MKMPRFAGDELFARNQQMQQQLEQINARQANIMERQRRRDVAAAVGQFIPFTEADMM